MAGEGDSISPELRFLEEFSKVGGEIADSEDDGGTGIQYRTSGCYVNENDFDGEVTDWALQYLYLHKCPFALAAAVARLTCEELKQTDLNNCIFQENGDAKSICTLDSNKLQQAVYRKVHEICEQWREKPILTPQKRQSYIVSVCAVRNGRRKMEDRHVLIPDLSLFFGLENKSPQGFFAVFDGHAGVEAAVYGAAHLHHNIVRHPSYDTDIHLAIKEGFKKTDELFIEKATREKLKSGSTAVCAIVQESKLHIAWVGDSQAFLVRQGEVVEFGKPHKASRNDEKDRIENLGGCVVFYGMWRVNGTLAITRAIGDVEYKPYVCSDPDIISLPRIGSEDFLVMACDGLWDVTTPEDAAYTVYSTITNAPDDIPGVSEKLVQTAVSRKSSDNISVIVVFLRDPHDIAKDGIPQGLSPSNQIPTPLTPKLPEGTVTNGESPTKISNLWLSEVTAMHAAHENNGVAHESASQQQAGNPFAEIAETEASEKQVVTDYFLPQSEEQNKFSFQSESVITTTMTTSTGSMSLDSFDSKPFATTPSADEIYASVVGEKIPISPGQSLFQATDIPAGLIDTGLNLEKIPSNPGPDSDAERNLTCVTATSLESTEQKVVKEVDINIVASKSSLSPCAPEFIPHNYVVPESPFNPAANPFDPFCPGQGESDALSSPAANVEGKSPAEELMSSDIPTAGGAVNLLGEIDLLSPTVEMSAEIIAPGDVLSEKETLSEESLPLQEVEVKSDKEEKMESPKQEVKSLNLEEIIKSEILLGTQQSPTAVSPGEVDLFNIRTPGEGAEFDLSPQKTSPPQRPETMPLEPIVVETIPETAPVAEDVVDDESEEGEEWRYFKGEPSGKSEDSNLAGDEQVGSTTPDNPVENAPTVPVSPICSAESEVQKVKVEETLVTRSEEVLFSNDLIPSMDFSEGQQILTSSPLPDSSQCLIIDSPDIEDKLKAEGMAAAEEIEKVIAESERLDSTLEGSLLSNSQLESGFDDFITQRGESRGSDNLADLSLNSLTASNKLEEQSSPVVEVVEKKEEKEVSVAAPVAVPVVAEVKPTAKPAGKAAEKSPTKTKTPVGTARPKSSTTTTTAGSKPAAPKPAPPKAAPASKTTSADKKPIPKTTTTKTSQTTSASSKVQATKTTTSSSVTATAQKTTAAAAKPKPEVKKTEVKPAPARRVVTATKSATAVADTSGSAAASVRKTLTSTVTTSTTTKSTTPSAPLTARSVKERDPAARKPASLPAKPRPPTTSAPTKDSKETANKQISSTVKAMSTTSSRLSAGKTANESISSSTRSTTATRTTTMSTSTSTTRSSRTTTTTTAGKNEPAKRTTTSTTTSTVSSSSMKTAKKPTTAGAALTSSVSKTASSQRTTASKRPTTAPAKPKAAASKAPTIPTSPTSNNSISSSQQKEEEAKEKGILDAKGKEQVLVGASSPPPPNIGFGDVATNCPQLVDDVDSPCDGTGANPSGGGDPPSLV